MRRNGRWLLIAVAFLGAWLGARWLTGAVIQSPTQSDLTIDAPHDLLGPRWHAPASTASSHTSSLSGVVRSAQGKPIAGALVCAAWTHDDLFAGERPLCVRSDASARYQLDELRVGAYYITASAVGFLSGAPSGPSPLVLDAQPRTDIDLVLSPGGALIAGVVNDAAGGVVPHARVRAIRMLDPLTSLEVESDEQGRFEISVPPGEIGLFAQADGYAQGSAGYVAPTSQAEITLVPESSVAGTIVSAADGEPVADVEVRAVRAEMPNVAVYRAGQSDARGRFRVSGLTPGAYLLTAQAGRWHGHASEPVEVSVAETVNDLTIQVSREQELTGRVLDADGKPCAQGAVILGAPDPELHGKELAKSSLDGVGPAQYARIEADGRVHFQGVPRAFYYVTVDCFGHTMRAGPKSLYVQDKPLEELTWTVAAGVKLKVRVVDGGGKPLPYQSFDLFRMSEASVTEHTLSVGPTGELVTPGLAPGEYELAPRGDAERGDKVHLSLREGMREVEAVLRLRGRGELLVEAKTADGKPVEKLEVSARRRLPAATASSAGPQAAPLAGVAAQLPPGIQAPKPAEPSVTPIYAEALGQGKYRIGALLEGQYVVTANDEVALNPAVTTSGTVQVLSGAVARAELVFPRSGTIRGHVSDERGERLPNVWVDVARASAEAAHPIAIFSALGSSKRVLTDTDGEFLLDGLAPDARYTVRASATDSGAVVQRDLAPGSELALRLPSPASLSGTVVDETGAPIPVFVVQASSSDALSTRQVEVRAQDGRFALSRVSPGHVELSVSTPSGRAGSQHLQLTSNQKLSGVRIVLSTKAAERNSVAINP